MLPVPCVPDGLTIALVRKSAEREGTEAITLGNGMVERFNCRVQRKVLGITIYSHQDLEVLLTSFNVVYNDRRQRALKGLSPEMVLHQRLKDKPALARTAAKKADPAALDRALKVVA